MTVQFLDIDKKQKLAYEKIDGKGPGVVFLHGLRSNMAGTKALALEAFCAARGQAFIRFDCQGHGQSSGGFIEGTISQWADNAAAILTELTEGPQILVGSSMGGWLMLLMALRLPKKIKACIGLAAAPDFTEYLMPDQLVNELEKNGICILPGEGDEQSIPITKAFIDDGRKNILLNAPLDLSCPLHLIQGMQDQDVPWESALKIAKTVTRPDVTVTLIKDGDHSLSRPEDIQKIQGAIVAFSDF